MVLAKQAARGARIVASSQQTRFHITDGVAASQIHLPTLNISVVSSVPPAEGDSGKKKKTKQAELELLKDADLKLKRGSYYALMGKNGSGKSTLLRALGERLIPGIPPGLRVALLQQKGSEDDECEDGAESLPSGFDLPVIEFVVKSDPARTLLEHELQVISGNKSDPTSAPPRSLLKRYRQLQLERANRELLEYQNLFSLKSGARGAQARKDLLAFEEQFKLAEERANVPEEALEEEASAEEVGDATQLATELQQEMASLDLVDIDKRAREVLVGLGFSEERMQQKVKTLSGGWRMRAQLAATLLQTSDLMILDEPTNFLDLLGIIWLQQYLQKAQTDEKAVVIVSHDRAFVDSICDEVIILRDQKLAYFRGTLTEYEKDLRSKILYLTRMQAAQDKNADRLNKTIQANISLGKKSGDDNKLRMAKSRSKKLEMQSGMLVGQNGFRFKLNRDRAGFQNVKVAAIEIPTIEQGASMALPMATELRNPGPLVSLEKVSHRYSPRGDWTLKNINLVVHPGDRIGILGLNGSGKTTLIKIMAGVHTLSQGTMTTHPRLKLGYYSQHAMEELAALGSQTALQVMTREAGDDMSEQDIRGLLGSFGLSGQMVSDTLISNLSGGQLVRVALARTLWSHPNLLILDEVSTHLDYHTVNALGEALSDYDGAIVLVTHDRFLVRRVIENDKSELLDDEEEEEDEEEEDDTRRDIFVLSKGELKKREGGVTSYEEMLERRAAKLGAQPPS